jgi:hypothetical protein
VSETGIRTPKLVRDLWIPCGEPFGVYLVYDRMVPGDPRRPIALPIEGRISYDRLGDRGGVVARIEHQILPRIPDLIPEDGRRPIDTAKERFGIRIDQDLVRVEPVPVVRPVRTIDPIPIRLAGLDSREVAVPDVRRLLGQPDPVSLGPAILREQTEKDLLRVLGEDREVGPLTVPGRAEWIGSPGP